MDSLKIRSLGWLFYIVSVLLLTLQHVKTSAAIARRFLR